MPTTLRLSVLGSLALLACTGPGEPLPPVARGDGGPTSSPDGGRVDDAGPPAPRVDAGPLALDVDAGSPSRDAGAPARDAGPPAGTTLGEVLSRSLYEELFPNHHAIFTYEAFLAAAAYYPAFCAEGDLDTRKRELAAFLANVAHETTGGWDTAPGGRAAWGLYFAQEVGCESGACTGYCDPTNTQFPCAPGRTYHGRGPIQLSWNYNYGQVGAAIGEDLLGDPDRVARDGTLAFRTSIWFWMTPQAPKPSAHDVMTGQWTPSASDRAAGRAPGFGMTVVIINGGLECGFPTDDRVRDRLGFYARFTTLLAVTQGANLECASMRPY